MKSFFSFSIFYLVSQIIEVGNQIKEIGVITHQHHVRVIIYTVKQSLEKTSFYGRRLPRLLF